MTETTSQRIERVARVTRWKCPCTSCGARSLSEGYERCIDDTGHGDCAHSVLDTPCPMDEAFAEVEG